MLSDQMRTIDVEEQALLNMRYLASQVVSRPMLYGLVMSDVNKWSEMSADERKQALKRAIRRVGAACPWVRTKPRLQDC